MEYKKRGRKKTAVKNTDAGGRENLMRSGVIGILNLRTPFTPSETSPWLRYQAAALHTDPKRRSDLTFLCLLLQRLIPPISVGQMG